MGEDEKLNDKKVVLRRIWKIRDYIQELEDIKDGIIDFLNSRKKLDEVTKNLWISDVKGVYSATISAWELLYNMVSKGKLKHVDNSRHFLHWNAFYFEFDMLIPIIKPIVRIIKVSTSKYHLLCSVCGKISIGYRIGIGRFDEHESLIYTGITHSRSLRKELASELFGILKDENLLGVHQFMQKYHSQEGLDAYCPQCDNIYCWDHYKAREEYDDGFYDCTYGECPSGHRRMIDD
ncbi:MAG: hypothetical protein ACTSQL_00905 [Promethearchaeota archaeon]